MTEPSNSQGNQQKGTTHMSSTAIEVRGLRKSYGGSVVLDDVDLTADLTGTSPRKLVPG